jgi:hypothetical protein
VSQYCVYNYHSKPSYPDTFFWELTANTDVENILQRLDKLTQEGAEIALTELRKITHNDGQVMGVDDRVAVIVDRLWDLKEKEDDDHGNVQNADMVVRAWDPMKEDGEGQNVDMTTDDQLDQVNSGWRSLSL